LGLLDAIGLDKLAEMDETSRAARLLPVDRLVEILSPIHLDQQASQRIVNGLAVCAVGTAAGLVRLYDQSGTFLGVGESRSDGTVIPKRLVSNPPMSKNQAVGARLSS
jgi:tRNA U55 pseudouridine synthase TruB